MLESQGDKAASSQSTADDATKNSQSESQPPPLKEAGKVYIVPTLQMNVINYREDEQTFLQMLRQLVLSDAAASSDTRLKLATGYLNLQKEFLKELVQAKTPGKV